MKAIKYIMMGALMIAISTPVMAQDEDKATINAITKVIKSKAADTEDQVKVVFKKNKKDAPVLVGIGQAYLSIKDTVNATKYADLAIKAKKEYAPAYVLKGDIAQVKDDGGTAAGMYEMAIYFDKTNPEPYRKYAVINSKTSFMSSVAKLEELRKAVPTEPVDIQIAQLYERNGKIEDAIKYYEKADPAKMDAYNFASFGLMYNLNKQYDKSLAITEKGLEKFPRNGSLNRIGLINTIALKDYDKALVYGDRLFNKSDSVDLKDLDYINYAEAFLEKKDYDQAINMYKKTMEVSKGDKEAINNIYKNISTAYLKKGDYENAIKEYNNYMNGTSSKTANDYVGLANIYYSHAADLKGEAQKAELIHADNVYKDLQEKFPNDFDVQAYALSKRGDLNAAMDPTMKEFRAQPYFTQLTEVIEGKAKTTELDANDKSKLVRAYWYLANVYQIKNDKASAKSYWSKILNIDPTNKVATEAMEALK